MTTKTTPAKDPSEALLLEIATKHLHSIEAALFKAFYGEPKDWHTAGWRDMAAFSCCVLQPLKWAGLLVETREDSAGKHVCHVFKTPLWRSALKLDTDDMLRPISVQ